jgi:sulfatase modifying factor 1
MISLILLFSCGEEASKITSPGLEQNPQTENGFCNEPLISHIPVGSIDCQDDICFVGEGSFWMGSSQGIDECPVHQIELDSFYIDAKEVTNEQWDNCVFSGTCTLIPSECKPSQSAGQLDPPQILPTTCATWEQANTYCEWAGGRLPTEAEWEKAARGLEGATWAWGNIAPDCKTANFRLASIYCYQATSPVGYFESIRSAYGLWDTSGNVFEWTSDFYDADYYENSPSSNPRGPTENCNLAIGEEEQPCTMRVVRGGSFNTTADVIRGAARSFAPPDLIDTNIGLRCAYDQRN